MSLPPSNMDNLTLADKVTTLLDAASIAGAYQIAKESKLGVVVRIDIEDVISVLGALRQGNKDSSENGNDGLRFEQLIDVFGADVRDRIEVTYRLRSLSSNADLMVKFELPYGGTYFSVGEVYAAAWMPERELCEMFGLVLENHPNPKRLLTTEGLPPFLRKEVAIRTKEDIWGSMTWE